MLFGRAADTVTAMLRAVLIAVVLSLTVCSAASAEKISGGIAHSGKHVTIIFTCDIWVDVETGEAVRDRCYSGLNRYCNNRTWRCGKVAPWTRGSRSPASRYR